MSAREITFLIGFVILGVAPIYAGSFAFGVTEIIMLLGIVISTSAAFFSS
jgi:hypothetical protein